MVDESIVIVVKKYLNKLKDTGFEDCYAIIYGSYATGNSNIWSDIDVLIVSFLFDKGHNREHVNILWRTAAAIDSRIEPFPVGKRQYENDDSNAFIEIARRSGQIILPAA